MQRAEMEELRQKEANLTALLAIGPRKKPKLDDNSSGSTNQESQSVLTSNPNRTQVSFGFIICFNFLDKLNLYADDV
jgi:transcription initiation factor TFIID subunit 4